MSSHLAIARIDVFPQRYPTRGRFKFLEGPAGTPTGRPAVMVKITADDEAVGWGQSVPVPKWSYETLETATDTIQRYLAPELIGHDPTDIAGAHEIMNRAIAPGFSTGQPIAKAGIDIALHDLTAKRLGVPLATLWGRPVGEPLELSWTLNPTSLDDVDRLVQEGLSRGFRHVNIKVAPNIDFDIALAKRVRELVPDGFLWADANGGYEPNDALRAAPRLADVGVDVLESPVRPNRIATYQALKRQGALPILMDEGVVSPHDLIEFIRLGMMDGVAMKPSRCGGLLSCRRQIEIILDAGLMWLGSGLTDPDVALAATVALYAAYDLKTPAALNGPQFLDDSVLRQPLQPHEGRLAVSSGPGLGIEVDEDRLIEKPR